jgi:hypothetical protein
MPTIRRRHAITETPDIAEALDDAAVVWPELRNDRTALLRKLIEQGRLETARAADERIAAVRQAIRDGAGVATGDYPRQAASELKREWPA